MTLKLLFLVARRSRFCLKCLQFKYLGLFSCIGNIRKMCMFSVIKVVAK
jgi:hypothetical protein